MSMPFSPFPFFSFLLFKSIHSYIQGQNRIFQIGLRASSVWVVICQYQYQYNLSVFIICQYQYQRRRESDEHFAEVWPFLTLGIE